MFYNDVIVFLCRRKEQVSLLFVCVETFLVHLIVHKAASGTDIRPEKANWKFRFTFYPKFPTKTKSRVQGGFD